MLVVVASLKAKKGNEQEMEDLLRWMIPNVDAEVGALVYVLHRSKKDPRIFLMFEKFRDENALSQHTLTQYYRELTKKIGPLLDGKPSIEIYEELASIQEKIYQSAW